MFTERRGRSVKSTCQRGYPLKPRRGLPPRKARWPTLNRSPIKIVRRFSVSVMPAGHGGAVRRKPRSEARTQRALRRKP